MKLFHYSLNPSGFLLLGSAESIGTAAGLFSPLAGKSRIYRRLDAPGRVLASGFPVAFGQTCPKLASAAEALDYGKLPSAPNLELLVEKMVLQRHTAAAVLVTDQGELLYFSGKTGKYLEPAAGTPSVNLFAMAREGLNQALGEALTREQDVPATDGRWFKVRTMPYRTQENRIDGLVITFSDISASKKLEAALRATQARLQTLMESAKLLGVGHGLS